MTYIVIVWLGVGDKVMKRFFIYFCPRLPGCSTGFLTERREFQRERREFLNFQQNNSRKNKY